MALFLGYKDAGTVLLSKCEAERVRIDNMRGATSAFTGVTLSKRRPRRTWMDDDKEEKAEVDDFQTDKDKVCAKRASSRITWLEKGLMLAGSKKVSTGTVYDIITSKHFLDGVADADGIALRKLLFANLHVFPHSKQQKYLKSAECGFQDFSSEVKQKSTRGANDGDEESEDGRHRSRSRSQRQKNASSSDGESAGKQEEFKVGQRVRRRDKGKEWGIGYVLSLDPLKITVKDDPNDVFGFRFHKVEPLPLEPAPKEEKASHANRTAFAFAGVWKSHTGEGTRRDGGGQAPIPEGLDPRVYQPGAMDEFLDLGQVM